MPLPDHYLAYALEQLPNFQKGSANWDEIEECFRVAKAKGIQRNDSRTLLVGLAACEQWLNEPSRMRWLGTAQSRIESTRSISNTKFGNQSHTHAKQESRKLTSTGIRQIESYISLGFVYRIGQTRMREYDWEPLFPSLIRIFKESDDDIGAGERIFERIRQRIRRLRKSNESEFIDIISSDYFESLYATLFV